MKRYICVGNVVVSIDDVLYAKRSSEVDEYDSDSERSILEMWLSSGDAIVLYGDVADAIWSALSSVSVDVSLREDITFVDD